MRGIWWLHDIFVPVGKALDAVVNITRLRSSQHIHHFQTSPLFALCCDEAPHQCVGLLQRQSFRNILRALHSVIHRILIQPAVCDDVCMVQQNIWIEAAQVLVLLAVCEHLIDHVMDFFGFACVFLLFVALTFLRCV